MGEVLRPCAVVSRLCSQACDILETSGKQPFPWLYQNGPRTPSTMVSNHWLYCSIEPTHSGKTNTSPLSVRIDLRGVWPFSSFFYITGPTEESMPRGESNWSTWSNKVDSLVSLLITKGHQDLGLDKALSSEASKSTGMAQGCFTRLRRCFNSRDHDVWSKSLQPSMWSLDGPSAHRSS